MWAKFACGHGHLQIGLFYDLQTVMKMKIEFEFSSNSGNRLLI